jgi:hypothetical protein
MKTLAPIVITLLFAPGLLAQKTGTMAERSGTVSHFFVLDGDTIPWVFLNEAVVSSEISKVNRYSSKYLLTQKRVLKVYPYAKAAGVLMEGYNREMEKLPTKKAQKAYLEKAEEDLKKQFEMDIRDMTTTEGLILIRLIDRETGNTSYNLISELRSSFKAFFWQGVARLFGHNLKDQYDPEGDDIMIEDICRRIERGELQVSTTKADAPTAQHRQGRRK